MRSHRSSQPDPLDPDIIKNFNNLYKYEDINPDYYAKKPLDAPDASHLRRILAWYLDYFTSSDPAGLGASILFPIGALRALRHLSGMSRSRAFVISGDKGNNNVEQVRVFLARTSCAVGRSLTRPRARRQFRGLMDPHIAIHGSFSLMVNYHAVGAYFTSRGGFALHNPQEKASLKVSCFVLPPGNKLSDDDDGPFLGEGLERLDGERSRQFPRLREAFQDYAQR